MRSVKRVLVSLLLLTLFTTYVVSITMFTHMHYVNGVMVVHSHLYKGTHSHTESNILIMAHFASFHSLEADVHQYEAPERLMLYTVEEPESISVLMGEHFKVLSLRAPPSL
ncbi:hypothetical protein [Bacteroides sp.]